MLKNIRYFDGKETAVDLTKHDGATEIRNTVTGNCGEVGYTHPYVLKMCYLLLNWMMIIKQKR